MKRQRILVFQIGSLGDTVIAMPCYREIARRHPNAERLLLTNFPIGTKMVQAQALLAPCGLIEDVVAYPMPLRGAANITSLYRRLRGLHVDILYYLTPEKRLLNLIRHVAFFKAAGIRKIEAVPWSLSQRYPAELVPGKLWESEASRLLRNVDRHHQPGPPPAYDRALDLTAAEHRAADALLADATMPPRFLALSVGGKVPLNDWGDANWSAVLAAIAAASPGLGVVFIGSADERVRNDRLAAAWSSQANPGPVLNSCGLLTPRETAALLARATLFLGHDTGTLHLAAAVATPVIGIYSARNVPGKWYSDRPADIFLYHQPPCFGCELERPTDCPHDLVCMTSHRPETVVATVLEVLARA